jgi:hypothetical protein
MNEEQEIVNRELLGDSESKPCALCGISKPNTSLLLVTAETIGHVGGGNVDVCVDCYRGLQRGDVEPIGDPEF